MDQNSTTSVRSAAFTSQGLRVPGVLSKISHSVVSIQSQIVQNDGPFSQTGEGDGTGIVLNDSGDQVEESSIGFANPITRAVSIAHQLITNAR